MTSSTTEISSYFNEFAEGAERLWDKAVVYGLGKSERLAEAVIDTGASMAKGGTIAGALGAAFGVATYYTGGFHVDTAMQAAQGGALLSGMLAGPIAGFGFLQRTMDNDATLGKQARDAIETYKNEYAARNNVALG